MRGLTDEEAGALRDELLQWGEPEVITDAEHVIYDRLVARGLLRFEQGTEGEDSRWFTTETGRRVLGWHEMLRMRVAA